MRQNAPRRLVSGGNRGNWVWIVGQIIDLFNFVDVFKLVFEWGSASVVAAGGPRNRDWFECRRQRHFCGLYEINHINQRLDWEL